MCHSTLGSRVIKKKKRRVLRVPAESVLERDGLLHGEVGPVPLEPSLTLHPTPYRVQGVRFRVQDLGFRIEGSGLGV